MFSTSIANRISSPGSNAERFQITRTLRSLFASEATGGIAGRAGSPSAGFMLRKGAWKYHHYVGYPPELFNLDDDPEELNDVAGEGACADVLRDMEAALEAFIDPQAVDRRAKADQKALIEKHGGVEAAQFVGAPAATPVPGAKAAFGT